MKYLCAILAGVSLISSSAYAETDSSQHRHHIVHRGKNQRRANASAAWAALGQSFARDNARQGGSCSKVIVQDQYGNLSQQYVC